MKLLSFCKKVFKIEYIIIYIAIINFSFILYYKSNAIKQLNQLDNIISYIQFYNFETEFSLPFEPSVTIDNFSSYLKNQYLPFTYFDNNLEVLLNNIITVFDSFKNKSYSTREHNQFINLTFDFQNQMHIKQRKLIFGYDSLLYCSLVLIIIAAFVIIYKNFTQKNELNRIQLLNEEQLKFSRNLHDGVAQDLAAVKLYLQKNDKEKSDFYATQALNEVRYLIGSLHLDLSSDFEKIISETISIFQNNYGIQTNLLIASSNLQNINQDIQIKILRILQESLSNIARHANASLVTIKFTEIANDLKIIISDNGKGFSEEEVISKNLSNEKKHYGLNNIRERVKNMNGTVEFINEGGTTIAITIKNIIH